MDRPASDEVPAPAASAPEQRHLTGGSSEAVAACGPDGPDAAAEAPERGTASVELLWDLVFVFAVTQVATLLSRDPSWVRLGEGMLVLALVWWAWSAFVWAANAHDADAPVLRAHLLVATVGIFIVGLALPRAFGSGGVPFAVAYAIVRLVHLSLYGAASRLGRAAWRSIAGFTATALVGMALLVGGAIVSGWPRAAAWTIAVAIDYAGPAWLTRDRLRGLQQVSVAHFADRYGDFVIICLGESILSIGVGVGEDTRRLTAGLAVGATLALAIAIAMWWTYFDRLAGAAQQRLRRHGDPVLAAADSFSYLHVVIVAGIIIYAAGIKLVVHESITSPMNDPGRLAFCGGIAVYLLGVSAFRLRLLGGHSPERLVVAGALVVLWAASAHLPSWSVCAIAAAMMAGLCAGEAATRRSAVAAGARAESAS